MSALHRDKITPIIDLMRSREFALAVEASGHPCADCDAGETEALSHCGRLAQWYLAGLEGRVEEGLSKAVTAVFRLSEAGWREQLGFAYGSIGFVFGLLGNFETGLEWLEVAIQDAQRRKDREQLAGVISQKGGLLGFTEEWSAAFDCFSQALKLAGPAPSVPRTKALNNLSYTQYLRASQGAGLSRAQRHRLALEALASADRALTEVPDPAPARWRSWGLSNRAAALAFLGRHEEAEQAFQEGLALGLANPRGHLEIRVGYAALLIELGQPQRASKLLEQAAAEAPAGGLVDASVDRIFELQIRLAVAAGHYQEAVEIAGRRFRQAEDRYRIRLRNVRRHMKLFEELELARHSQAQNAEQMRDKDEQHSELRQQARFWRNEALRDAVTGALNLRGLEQSAPRLLALVRPVALVMVQIDDFQALVAHHGWTVGNELVAQAGLLLTNAVRNGDLLARVADQGFCLVLAPSDGAYARMIGKQIRSTMASHAWEGIADGLEVSVSVGTVSHAAGDSLLEMMGRAEAALKRSRSALAASTAKSR